MTAAGAGEPRLPARGLPRLLATTGALAVLALLAIDIAAVPAVLPSVRVELGSSSSGLVWVQDSYLLALAVTLLLVTRTGVDRRLLAATGVAVFAGGALLASTADETATVVTGRALQGIGMGGMLVAALESLRIGGRGAPVFAGTGALLALAVAPLAGGAVAEEASWPWLFRIEAVAAIPALLLLALKTESRAAPLEGDRTSVLAAGLILAVTGLVQSGPWGWASADTLLLVAGGAAVIVFARLEGPVRADAPVLVLAGCLAVGLLVAPQYLELVRGLSPLRSGLLTAVLTVSAATLAALARILAGRLPSRVPLVGGLACAAIGALGMTRIDPASSYALVVVSLGLLGSGLGAAAAGSVGRLSHAYGAFDGPHSAGDGPRLAAAAASGAALVVAAAGALLQRAQLEEREGGGSFEDALAAGLAASGWLMAALLVAAAVLAWRRAPSD